MRTTAFILAATIICIGPASGARFDANDIRFENLTGTVEIAANTGDELEVIIRQGKDYRPVRVSVADGVVTVAGEIWREDLVDDCCNSRIRREFHPRKGRKMSKSAPFDEGFFEDFPTILVTMPRAGDVSFIDARVKLSMESINGSLSLDACYVYGEAGDADEAVIGVVAGSRLVMGDIAAGLEIDVSGDADVMTGDAAMADINIAGAGDVMIGDIDGMLDVSIAGSGLLRAARLDGPLTARIAGSGAVAVQAGRADSLRAVIDGSGGVLFEGEAVRPDLRLSTSAEVRLGSVSGRLKRAGGGDVYVGGDLVER